MAEIKVYYEPDTELMTIFWSTPRADQISTELDDGIILIKDSITNEPIGIELLSFKPEDNRISGLSLYIDKISAQNAGVKKISFLPEFKFKLQL